jgi:hypothetical protein
VFWADQEPTTGFVRSCPLAGCNNPTPFAVAQEDPGEILIDDGGVYWSAVLDGGGAVWSCPVSGCGDAGPTLLATATSPIGLGRLVADDAFLYWGYNFGISRCAKSACDAGTVATGVPSPASLTVDAVNVYWSTLSPIAIYSQAKTGAGAAAPLISNQPLPLGVAIGAGRLFWTNELADGGSVASCALPSCDAGAFATGQTNPSYLKIDASGVYWIDRGTPPTANGAIVMCPLSGCGAGPVTLAAGQLDPQAITLDATSVYWTLQTGNVMKVAKP